jgi:outer membrane protein assembly factor BamB
MTKMMKKVSILLILPIMLSCILYVTPPSGETNFPLKRVASISIDGVIRDIAVGETWIALHTHDDKIIAIDINTHKILWETSMDVNNYGESFKMVDNKLFASSQDQIIIVDQQGQEKEIALAPLKENFPSPINIIKVAAISPDYLYVIRGSNWTLEAYDISQNTVLWEKQVGRGIGSIFYDISKNLAYVSIGYSVYAFENNSGKLLWEIDAVSGRYFEGDVLYMFTDISSNDIETLHEINAVDIKNKKKLWLDSLVLPPNYRVNDLMIVGNSLIVGGDGIIAIDKSVGKQMWTIDVHKIGEEFEAPIIEFNKVLYAVGSASGTVFAISLTDGSVIGTVNLESDNLLSSDSNTGVYNLEDGILFNTRTTVVIYKVK